MSGKSSLKLRSGTWHHFTDCNNNKAKCGHCLTRHVKLRHETCDPNHRKNRKEDRDSNVCNKTNHLLLTTSGEVHRMRDGVVSVHGEGDQDVGGRIGDHGLQEPDDLAEHVPRIPCDGDSPHYVGGHVN